MPLTFIVIVPDVKTLEDIRNQLTATGANKFIVEVPNIVVPRNMAQVIVFAEQVKPLAPYLKDFSKMFAALFEIQSNNLPTP